MNAVPGLLEHHIKRTNLYKDVLDLYREGDIVGEYPISISFQGELGVDNGGVQRDMFSAFWEQGYSMMLEGATLLTPMIHPQSDLSLFSIIGRILSHGYLVTGIIPIRIALPTLTRILLGPTATISPNVLMDSFLDNISSFDRDTLKRALAFSNDGVFSSETRDELTSTLAKFGCRLMPTP